MSVQFKTLVTAAATAVFLFMGQHAVAQQQGACYDPCWNLCGEWEVGAHALYLTPITCPYAYADVFLSVPDMGDPQIRIAQVEAIPCRAEWGFRVFGNYLHDCFFTNVSYQWFQVTTTRSVTANSLLIQGGDITDIGPGAATAQEGIEYQNADVKVGTPLLRTCYCSLSLYGNARWVDLWQRRSVRVLYTGGNFQEVQEKSQLEGGALGIGLSAETDAWCGIDAFIDGNLLGVIGNRSITDVRFRRRAAGSLATSIEVYPSETCVIPEVNFRIGLNYTYACGCWKLVGEVGYEVDYFWHASVLPDLTGVQLATGDREFIPVCEDLGFSGLFFGGRLIF